MHAHSRWLEPAALAVAVAVALGGAACGASARALRSEGPAASTTTMLPSTTVEDRPAGSTPLSTTVRPTTTTTTTTTIGGRPVVTTVPTHAGSGLSGTVVFGPVCPVERIPPDPQCAPRPGAADIRLVAADGSVAARATAGTDGRFALAVPPGTYRVEAVAAAPGPGRGCQAEPAMVTVADTVVTVAVTCDTGIR